MLKEIILAYHLFATPVSPMEKPQVSMPDLSNLEVRIGKTFDCGDLSQTQIIMKNYIQFHPEPECRGHLKYITATRKGHKIPYIIFDGNDGVMYLDNGINGGKAEDGWRDYLLRCKPGEMDACNLIPKAKYI